MTTKIDSIMGNNTIINNQYFPIQEGETPVPLPNTQRVADEANRLDNNGINQFLALFDVIWQKILVLAKQLRDIMQSYNQKKQQQGWEIEIHALETHFKAIEQSFVASVISGSGKITAGLIGLAGGWQAKDQIGLAPYQGTSQMLGGGFEIGSASVKRQAETDNAIANLQDKNAQSYAKTLDDTLVKAREIMQQINSFGQRMMEMLAQALNALSR